MERTKPPKSKTKEPERKQVGIHVDVELWRRFRAKCLEEGTQAGYKIEKLIADYLQSKDQG
jgi:hypothetical protein